MTTNDTAVGFDRPPDRYSAKDRETIDRMRDRCWELAGELEQDPARRVVLADAMFAAHCDLTAMKYEDRAGLKGDEAEDRSKALWYRLMESHVRSPAECEDPRSARDGFESYELPKR